MNQSKVTYEIEVTLEDMEVRGNAMASGDPVFDKQVEDEIINRVNNGDIWAWAFVAVIAKYKGFQGSDNLGCCCYKDEEDFKQSGYFEDMKKQALENLKENINASIKRGKLAQSVLVSLNNQET